MDAERASWSPEQRFQHDQARAADKRDIQERRTHNANIENQVANNLANMQFLDKTSEAYRKMNSANMALRGSRR